MKKLIEFIFKYWRWFLGIKIVITIFFICSLLNLTIDNSLETMTVDNDPDLELLRHMDEEYGGDEFVVVSFKGEDIFSMNVFDIIERMTNRIERVHNVEKVLSLLNVNIIKGNSDGFGIYPLIPENLLQSGDIDAVKKGVIENKLYQRMLYSDDGNATSIMAWLVPLGNNDAARVNVINEIKNIINEEGDGRRFYFYGMPVYITAIFGASVRDQIILTPIVVILIGLMFFYFFRNWSFVISPFIIIYISAVWAEGLLVFTGNTLNFITMLIPVILLIVCIAVSVHIITHYMEIKDQYKNRIDSLKNVIINIGVPILLTSLTTAIGFFSLVWNSIKPVRNFGFFLGMGVLFAFVSSITILPIILSFINSKEENFIDNKNFQVLDGLLIRIGEFVYRRKGFIVILSLVITIISIIGISRLEVRQDTVGILKNKELHEAGRFIDLVMGGSCEIDMLVDGKRENAILEPKNLKVLERVQNRMKKEVLHYDTPVIRSEISILNYLKEMNQAINGGNPDYYRIPSTKGESIDFLEIIDKEKTGVESIINHDYSKTRMRAFILSGKDSVVSRKAINMAKKIVEEETGGTEMDVVFTGRPVIWSNMIDYLISGMIESFFYAFIAIIIMMVIVFRSIRLGILSMILNIIPVIVSFGIMGWMNIPINMITVMIPSIAIGLAVDDTIHFFWRMVKEVKEGGDYKEAMMQTLKSVGKPIILTSLLLCVGFSALYFSQLVVLVQFAFVTSIIIIMALIADLYLGPALILIFTPVKK